MRKILLSLSVVVGFAAYSLHTRSEQGALVIARPASLSAPSTAPATQSAPSSSMPAASPAQTSGYKDGTYTGQSADAFYGNVQVQVNISNGRMVAVSFLQYPNDRGTSVRINSIAMPYLRQEAIQAQSAQVDGVSGASDTSQAFTESLSSALDKAKV